jgi:hypothetical protein
LQDIAFDVENWLFRKVSEGMRAMINEAVLIGDGIGKLQETSTSAVGHSDLRDSGPPRRRGS